MERIGIYGGTFNPPHTGHIHAARQALEKLGLDRLLMIPTRVSPHKALPQGSASPRQRLEMVQIAAKNIPGVTVSDLELGREGPSYTWQTVQQLHREHPDAQLVLLMGTDMFLSFETWKNPEFILDHAILAVFYRGERGEKEQILQQKALLESKGARIELVENDILEISSTDLRRLLAFRCAAPFLPEGVGEYITEHSLYFSTALWKNLPMEQLEPVVVQLMNPNRVAHVLGVRDTAVQLAKRWGADVTDAARAGLLHDITKALDGPLQLTLCREYGTMLDDFGTQNPKTLHAFTGALVAQRIFGENEAVVGAIRNHTTGKANMSLLEKIVYIADYMEPNRKFPGVEKLRDMVEKDLDEAVRMGLTMTLELLKSRGQAISPESRQALEYLNQK